MVSNKVILKQMIRLSRTIKNLKESRMKMNAVQDQTEYFVCQGESLSMIHHMTNENISNCLYLEKYLRSSVSNSCKCLDGFIPGKMEPIDYISSSDVKNKFVDICLGKRVVATINLTTGTISPIEPEQNLAEEKRPSEKS